jgi:dTDP-4-amino-4,6-dideoxygalactose transaminase
VARKAFDEADLAAVRRVLESGNLGYVGGRAAPELEAAVRARLGCRYALAIHSAMAGLQMGLMTLGVGRGDEVICDPIVPFGAKAVLYQHARPVFADVDPLTHNIDPASIRERITGRTKAIVVTHLWGLPAPMDEIMAIARERRLGVVEDCAHATFATLDGRECGTFGTAGVFSFQQQKHVSTGDGGLLVTDDPYIRDECDKLLRFGVIPPRLSWNFRMNEITAAVAGVQWARADGYLRKTGARPGSTRRSSTGTERCTTPPAAVAPGTPTTSGPPSSAATRRPGSSRPASRSCAARKASPPASAPSRCRRIFTPVLAGRQRLRQRRLGRGPLPVPARLLPPGGAVDAPPAADHRQHAALRLPPAERGGARPGALPPGADRLCPPPEVPCPDGGSSQVADVHQSSMDLFSRRSGRAPGAAPATSRAGRPPGTGPAPQERSP